MENKGNTLLFPNLRFVMLSQGVTIPELAKMLGIHKNTVRRKMNGLTSWTLEEIDLVSDVLKNDIKYLFVKNN